MEWLLLLQLFFFFIEQHCYIMKWSQRPGAQGLIPIDQRVPHPRRKKKEQNQFLFSHLEVDYVTYKKKCMHYIKHTVAINTI